MASVDSITIDTSAETAAYHANVAKAFAEQCEKISNFLKTEEQQLESLLTTFLSQLESLTSKSEAVFQHLEQLKEHGLVLQEGAQSEEGDEADASELEHIMDVLRETPAQLWLQQNCSADEASMPKQKLFDFVDHDAIDNLVEQGRHALEQIGSSSEYCMVRESEIRTKLKLLLSKLHVAFPNEEEPNAISLPQGTTDSFEESSLFQQLSITENDKLQKEWSSSIESARNFLHQEKNEIGKMFEGERSTANVIVTLSTLVNQVHINSSQPELRSEYDLVRKLCSNDTESNSSAILEGATKTLRDKLRALANGASELTGKLKNVKAATAKVQEVEQGFAKLATHAHETVLEVGAITQQIPALKGQVVSVREELKHLHNFYDKFLGAQGAAGTEVMRRWSALARMEKLVMDCQAEINSLYQDEVSKRSNFHEQHGQYLPRTLCPALALPPTVISFFAEDPRDAQLLYHCVKAKEQEDGEHVSLVKPSQLSPTASEKPLVVPSASSSVPNEEERVLNLVEHVAEETGSHPVDLVGDANGEASIETSSEASTVTASDR